MDWRSRFWGRGRVVGIFGGQQRRWDIRSNNTVSDELKKEINFEFLSYYFTSLLLLIIEGKLLEFWRFWRLKLIELQIE